MLPCDCPKYETCSAAVCPLDATPTVHLGGEKVCPHLLALGKAGADERYATDQTYLAVRELAAGVRAAHPEIGRQMDKAARYGFRDSKLARAQAARHHTEGQKQAVATEIAA